MASLSIASRAERLVYRIAGLPVALSGLLRGNPADPMRSAFVWHYWHPADVGEWCELIAGLVTWPIALVLGAAWYTTRNGAIVRRRTGRGIAAQFADQLRLYFSAGVLAPWYYIFWLDEDGDTKRAQSFIQRFETKPVLFPLLKRRKGSPLNQKDRFAAYCAERGIRCVHTVAQFYGTRPSTLLPDGDLFVKPSGGRGGKGAERWDLVAPGRFAGPEGEQLTGDELLMRLVERSRDTRLIVQPRLNAHPALADLTTGALPTIRIVTCLDEHEAPEAIGGVFRMSIGDNRTVDNFHAGGIAANVDLQTGKLSRATNMGSDARLGWLAAHPNTGAQIEGCTLPLWEETKRLAIAAHREFADRVVIGWDIAILEDGPIVIEGNGNSDLDILQRFMRIGLREHRFGALLRHHLRARLPTLHGGFAPEPAAP
jgi:hypothetical protein